MRNREQGHDAAEQQFTALCHAFYDQVLGYALRRVDHVEDAGDVAAEVFLVAWRRLSEVPCGEGTLPWLYATARRVLANQHRGRRRHYRLVARLTTELARQRGGSPDPAFETESVAAAFASLPSDDREVLALVAWEGMDSQGLAAVLGCRPGTARVRLHRARRRLAVALESQGLDPRPVPRRGGSENRHSSRQARLEEP